MLNEMGYNPPITLICSFKKSNLPVMCNFFFGITLRHFNGRSCGIDKAKLQFYFVIVSLYYRMKVNYDSLLREDFRSYVKHSKKSSEIANACLWSLILHKVYNQVGILFPEGVEVAQF